MNDPQVQYVSDDQGEVSGVILSILLWRDILSELETQHLLKSEAMRQRLLDARKRSTGVAFDAVIAELDLG
ncbi:MAG: prevent-host-death protein [Cyanobacteria bacterium J06638_6]